MTLREYRINLGWSQSDLAEKAGISVGSISSAEQGGKVRAKTAKKIVDALSRAYGREITVLDIRELNVQ